jgi:hypothetical protein
MQEVKKPTAVVNHPLPGGAKLMTLTFESTWGGFDWKKN